MILLLSAVLGIGVGLLFGGSVRRCAHYPLRGALLPIAALLIKFGASLLFEPQKFAVAVCALQYALVFLFLLINRKLAVWPPVLFAGAFSNFLVILLNGGCMPVSAALMGTDSSRAAALKAGEIYAYVAVTSRTKLPFLGDVLRFGPAGMPIGFASAGDLVLCAGVLLLALLMTRYRGTDSGGKTAAPKGESGL